MVSIKEFSDDRCAMFDEDENNQDSLFNTNKICRDELNQSESILSSDEQNIRQQKSVDDLLALSSLMLHHIDSNNFISSESRLVHSKFQRLFHFLVTDVHNESMTQALADHITNLTEVDETPINLSRNATLKFRNYKQFREQVCFVLLFK